MRAVIEERIVDGDKISVTLNDGLISALQNTDRRLLQLEQSALADITMPRAQLV